jgi:hypothetical protein
MLFQSLIRSSFFGIGAAVQGGMRHTQFPGAKRGESRGGYWERETSESFNPMDGFGMKQGRADEGGKKRHEAEKA